MAKQFRAFTVIEILIALIITGILAVIGIIGFREVMQNNKAATISNEFVASLAYARSEAIQKASSVSICAAANSNLLACGSNSDWANGWIIFLDPNNTGVLPSAASRLKVHEALEQGTQITSNAARVTYNSAGFVIAGAGPINITVTGCTGNNGRQLTLTNTGRTDIVQTAC